MKGRKRLILRGLNPRVYVVVRLGPYARVQRWDEKQQTFFSRAYTGTRFESRHQARARIKKALRYWNKVIGDQGKPLTTQDYAVIGLMGVD